MTSIYHLHEETKMLSVQDHLPLICSQYLARALQLNNPSHSVVTAPSGSRNMKKPFNVEFSIVLVCIYRAIFYSSLVMGPPSSPYILELFRMLLHKLFRKKQTFLDHTEVPLHNFFYTQIINRVSQKKVYFSKREKE